MVTHYATLLCGSPFDRRSLSSAVYPCQITAFSSVPSSFVLCFMFYVHVLCFIALPLGLDFYGVCLCWIMDLECLCLVLRLWQRCIVTRLGLRQSSRLSFFATRRLRRHLLPCHFYSLSSPVFVFSVALISESTWPRPSSFNLGFFVRRSRRCWVSRGLSTVGGRYCHKCRSLPYVALVFSSHFRT
jgi:hypothetical protein